MGRVLDGLGVFSPGPGLRAIGDRESEAGVQNGGTTVTPPTGFAAWRRGKQGKAKSRTKRTLFALDAVDERRVKGDRWSEWPLAAAQLRQVVYRWRRMKIMIVQCGERRRWRRAMAIWWQMVQRREYVRMAKLIRAMNRWGQWTERRAEMVKDVRSRMEALVPWWKWWAEWTGWWWQGKIKSGMVSVAETVVQEMGAGKHSGGQRGWDVNRRLVHVLEQDPVYVRNVQYSERRRAGGHWLAKKKYSAEIIKIRTGRDKKIQQQQKQQKCSISRQKINSSLTVMNSVLDSMQSIQDRYMAEHVRIMTMTIEDIVETENRERIAQLNYSAGYKTDIDCKEQEQHSTEKETEKGGRTKCAAETTKTDDKAK